jgi:hypothetical protein
VIPAHTVPTDQLSSFPALAARLLPRTGDVFRCGPLEVVLDLSLPPDAVVIRNPIIARDPAFELLDQLDQDRA